MSIFKFFMFRKIKEWRIKKNEAKKLKKMAKLEKKELKKKVKLDKKISMEMAKLDEKMKREMVKLEKMKNKMANFQEVKLEAKLEAILDESILDESLLEEVELMLEEVEFEEPKIEEAKIEEVKIEEPKLEEAESKEPMAEDSKEKEGKAKLEEINENMEVNEVIIKKTTKRVRFVGIPDEPDSSDDEIEKGDFVCAVNTNTKTISPVAYTNGLEANKQDISEVELTPIAVDNALEGTQLQVSKLNLTKVNYSGCKVVPMDFETFKKQCPSSPIRESMMPMSENARKWIESFRIYYRFYYPDVTGRVREKLAEAAACGELVYYRNQYQEHLDGLHMNNPIAQSVDIDRDAFNLDIYYHEAVFYCKLYHEDHDRYLAERVHKEVNSPTETLNEQREQLLSKMMEFMDYIDDNPEFIKHLIHEECFLDPDEPDDSPGPFKYYW